MGVVLLSSLTLFAQKESVNLGRVDFSEFELGSRTPTDTLWPGDFDSGTPSFYTDPDGGYVVGNNSYGDLGKGQLFISGATIVEGALFFFGAKEDGGNGSNVVAELRAFDGTTGTTTDGQGDQPSPGTLLSSVNMSLATDVDTSTTFSAATFSAPQNVDGDFYIGFNVAGLAAGDTVGLVSTEDGDGNASELTWEQWSDGTWYTMLAAWPLDFDFGIWAIIGDGSNGIEDESYFNGIKADCYPNPSVDVANIVFDLEIASKVSLEIYSLTGQKVYSIDKGQMPQGQHTLDIPVADFGAGTYYYSLNANGNRLTKKMVVK